MAQEVASNPVEQTGIPVPQEGTAEFEKLNRMAKRAIPLVLIIFIFGILEQQAFGMIFVNIGQQLGAPQYASLITSLPGIILGIVCVVYGSLGDFLSLKKMTFIGIAIFLLGSIIGFAGSSNIWAVIIARMLQSAGGQVPGSVFLVLVSKYITAKNRVIYYGIFSAIFRLSAAVGVLAAGFIMKLDWRWLFLLPLLSVFFLPALAKNLPDEQAKGAKIDGWGFLITGAFAGSVTMFFTNMTLYWFVAIIATLAAFIVYITKAQNPYIRPEFFTNPAFAITMIIIFVGYFFSYTLNAGVNAIGLNVFGIDSAEVSMLLIWSILLACVLGFSCGTIIKRIGRTAAIIGALGFMGLGLILIAWAIPHGKIAALALAPCVYYFGTSFFYSPIVDTAAKTVPAEEAGRVMGFNDLVQAITGSVGVAVFGNLMANGAMASGSPVPVEAGEASTYANVFLIGGIVVLSAMVLFIIFRKMIYRREY
ncbi:MFS transporter [Enterococcus sp.]|uniref:MFS transporter n=1 Tax=Enterococcus sp. TaxID=35783 RepID=UPI00290B8EB3|nr:MFS transporter [Enterococcus sp.]MDU5334155.1 MFS transporter [Enterococcus sp.]